MDPVPSVISEASRLSIIAADGYFEPVAVAGLALMLCIACGERMILLGSVPDHRMMVPGYEHQTLQCPACGEAERRLIFKPAKPPSASPSDNLPAGNVAEPPVEAFRKRQEARLCIACGRRIALIESVPDHNMMVPGYEHQTLRCRACGACERRLVFNPGS
jgi:predicted RNA-binding Zn-ribbon protein involved in translation (DUF1610 family)